MTDLVGYAPYIPQCTLEWYGCLHLVQDPTTNKEPAHQYRCNTRRLPIGMQRAGYEICIKIEHARHCTASALRHTSLVEILVQATVQNRYAVNRFAHNRSTPVALHMQRVCVRFVYVAVLALKNTSGG